jgi:hypothetical protein
MKKIFSLFLFLVYFTLLKGQNLVPNPGFELYDSCPNNQFQIHYASGWSSYGFTSDFFNSCAASFSIIDVPTNGAGYQPALGNGYAGFVAYFPTSSENREYLGRNLALSMIIGTRYYVTLKVSLSSIDAALGFNCATDHIGVRFSTIPFSFSSPAPTNNFAHIYTTNIITDTANWTTIQGSFIADSTYQYISIGNFFDDLTTNKTYFFPSSNYAAYYFVDDICVSTDSTYCATLIGISEDQTSSTIKTFPNPFSTITTIELNEPVYNSLLLSIYNSSGQIVRKTEEINDTTILIKREDLGPGIYFFTLTDNEKTFFKTGKLIITPKEMEAP